MVIRSTDRRRESAISAGRERSGFTYSPSQPPHRNSRDLPGLIDRAGRNTMRHSSRHGLDPEKPLEVDEPPWAGFVGNIAGTHARPRMLASYAARIEDLGLGDFLKVDCAACHHVALLTREALLRLGLRPAAKVLDLKGRLRCRGCGRKGRAVVSVKWRGQGG
jgi:hypothetical protein